MQATVLEDEVTDAGHETVGPASTVAAAVELINRKPPDFALIAVVLRGKERVYALARKLDARNIPFAFVTVVPPARIRARWQDRLVLRKPYDREQCRRLIGALATRVGCT